MFIKYKKTDQNLSLLNKQHNIMCLVGNGFDVAMLNKHKSGIMNATSSYPKFYEYIEYYYDEKLSENLLYKKMKAAKEANDKKTEEEKDNNWSDFEELIRQLVYEGEECKAYTHNPKDESAKIKFNELIITVGKDLDQLRNYFSEYLRELIPARVLIDLNNDARENKRAYRCLQGFLYDLNDGEEYKSMKFPKKLEVYDLYNYVFFDFNYSMLLDNYLSLDSDQFDPHGNNTVDTNFYFDADPHSIFGSGNRLNEDKINKELKKTTNSDRKQIEINLKRNKKLFSNTPPLSSYLLVDIIHPHGIHDAPRSMIFGTEDESYENNGINKRFIKHHWGQNDLKYSKYFNDAELFIIFGMSLGKSDGWWMGNIYKRLAEGKAELIIYSFKDGNGKTAAEIKDKFISSCIFYQKKTKSTKKPSQNQINSKDKMDKKVKKHIYVKIHDDNNTCFLGFSDTPINKFTKPDNSKKDS